MCQETERSSLVGHPICCRSIVCPGFMGWAETIAGSRAWPSNSNMESYKMMQIYIKSVIYVNDSKKHITKTKLLLQVASKQKENTRHHRFFDHHYYSLQHFSLLIRYLKHSWVLVYLHEVVGPLHLRH